jgi:hypothetical protein
MLQEILDAILTRRLSKVVACPENPISVPGTSADTDSGDAMGTIFQIAVPPSGIIYSATLWDLADQNKQTDIYLFKHIITQVADDAAWTCSDSDILYLITALVMVPTVDHTVGRTAELTNIGKAYTAPEGKFYCQAVDRGGQTLATAPAFQLQIIPDDPNWRAQ